jgi:DICT domain-containing protein
MTTHPTKDHLADFIADILDENGKVAVIEHLSTCDTCLEVVDQLWAATDLNRSLLNVPDLEQAATLRMRRNVVHRIHLAELWRQMIRFAGVGVLSTMQVLLRPIFGSHDRTGLKEDHHD